MRDKRYQLKFSASFTMYEFVSEGPNGRINKLVKYTESSVKGIYNLGFGDKLGDIDDFDDEIITNNQDSLRVLATVAATVYTFTDKYPDAIVFATGSTTARTRLYRMGISNNLQEIEEDFEVLGRLNEKWELFEKNRDYDAFLLTRK
jgi:hypothetical protein